MFYFVQIMTFKWNIVEPCIIMSTFSAIIISSQNVFAAYMICNFKNTRRHSYSHIIIFVYNIWAKILVSNLAKILYVLLYIGIVLLVPIQKIQNKKKIYDENSDKISFLFCNSFLAYVLSRRVCYRLESGDMIALMSHWQSCIDKIDDLFYAQDFWIVFFMGSDSSFFWIALELPPLNLWIYLNECQFGALFNLFDCHLIKKCGVNNCGYWRLECYTPLSSIIITSLSKRNIIGDLSQRGIFVL